jgi:predicted PurR-regulated permease PerM
MFEILIFGIPFVLAFITAYLQYARREKLQKSNPKILSVLTFLGVYILVFVLIIAIAISKIHC